MRFDIRHCPESAQCSLGIEPGWPLAMSNIKSHMENGKCFSFTVSRSTDCTDSDLWPDFLCHQPGVNLDNHPSSFNQRVGLGPGLRLFGRFRVELVLLVVELRRFGFGLWLTLSFLRSGLTAWRHNAFHPQIDDHVPVMLAAVIDVQCDH